MMKIVEIMLLGVCLIYGWIIAEIFGKENYNNIWIWTTFILFFINHSVVKYLRFFIHADEEENEE